MKKYTENIYLKLLTDYPLLNNCKNEILKAFYLIVNAYKNKNKLLLCGNGGSAADCEHITGELMKSFILPRPINSDLHDKLIAEYGENGAEIAKNLQGTLECISLTGHVGLTSAYINDVNAEMIFAQQLLGYGKNGDVLLGLSTSGNSKNVLNALKLAKVLGISTIGLCGRDGGLMKKLCDVCIIVSADETYQIQELHLPIYHALCAMLESEFFYQ